MLGSFHLFTVRDVPIRIHFTTLFLLMLIHQPGESLFLTLLFAVMILGSVALHELGHTVVAQRYGIHVQDIILTPIGGVARLRGLPEDPHLEIRIALAGPYISLALAVSGFLLGWLMTGTLFKGSAVFFLAFAAMNTGLLLFNMLPSFPMDGGRVLRGWLSLKKGPLEATRIAAAIGKVISIFFIFTGLIYPIYPLAIIGLFILLSAGTEYRIMQLKNWQGDLSGSGAPLETDFVASPPPYEKKKTGLKFPEGVAGDFIMTARDLYEEIRDSLFMN